MASMGGGYLDPDPTIRRLKGNGIVNKILQLMLVHEGLSKYGVKAELQDRLVGRIREHARNQDVQRFNRLKGWIEFPSTIPIPGGPSVSLSTTMNGYNHHTMPSAPPPPYTSQSSYQAHPTSMGNLPSIRGPGINFELKPSPFYQLREQIGDAKVCEIMSQHRHNVNIPVKVANHPILARVASDKTETLRVMVFCAGEAHGRQDIAFPHQSEVKVNTGEIRANLRGLKNKPGSTLPVDITKELRLNIPQYVNSVDMTYALTSKKFYFAVAVVQTVPADDLVKKLEVGKKITKAQVIRDMVNKSRDADIVATSTVLSLKCPLSTMRIDLPCRSTVCLHTQCFDAKCYLLLQMQAPTWLCPICNKPAPFDTLAVDEYVKDILENTSRSADQVIIEPDGTWKSHEKETPKNKPTGRSSMSFADDDDDDLIEVTKIGHIRADVASVYRTPSSAPMPNSREPSAASSVPKGSTGGKRPISAVIDLTSSGDEDEDLTARPPKRQFTMNGLNTPSHQLPLYRPGQASNGY